MIVSKRGSPQIRSLVAPLLVAVLLIVGCAPGPKGSSGPVVLEMKGKKVTLDTLIQEYEHANGAGLFAKASPDQKDQFLKTIGDKEILLATAEEKTPLTPDDEKTLQVSNDQKLLKGLEFDILRPINADSATSKAMLEKFKQQILVNWLVTDSDSLTKVARAEIAAGHPFAEVARRYSKADPTKVKDGALDWTSGMQFGRDFMEELFQTQRAPGYLSEVRQTPRGYELFQVKAYRPYGLTALGESSFFPELVKEIRDHNRLTAWSDSLQKAHGFQLHDDAVAALFAGMTPYWDSLKAQVQKTHEHVASFKPPASHFSAAQLKMPIFQFDGKGTTIEELFGSLPTASPRMWPNAADAPTFKQQVLSIALMQLELSIARGKGIDKIPGYILECRLDREKALLNKFQDMIGKEQPEIKPEDVKAYYDSHLESYRTKDSMLLSYFVFHTRPEADRFYAEALKHTPDWWAEVCADYTANHPEVHVVANSAEIDKNNPPAEIQPVVAKARDLKVNDVVGPTQTSGGWTVARVAFNQSAGILPIEKVDTAIRRVISDERIGSAMQKVIDEGQERYKMKLHPESLAPKA